jgi:hypothetical protein
MDLEKAFNRVPRNVLWWALRQLGVDEWIVRVIHSMYEGALTSVNLGVGDSIAFPVKVGVRQRSVLSPLLFIIVQEAVSKKFRNGLLWELFHANDLALLAESEEELLEMIRQWKDCMEQKGFKVNMGKTKVMNCFGFPECHSSIPHDLVFLSH